MSSNERVSVTRRIPASAGAIFAVVSDPAGHVAIDGSAMLVTAPGAKPLANLGDTFAMNMDREPLGDVPLGKYQVVNTVTRIAPPVLIEWNVGQPGRTPIGHVYGYELVDNGDGTTTVTSYCDWSAIEDKWRERVSFPVVPASMMERSLVNLERVVAARRPDDVEVVQRVLEAMGRLDVTEVRRFVADDLVLELPYRGGPFPTTLVGDDAHAFMRFVDKIFERMDFFDIVVHGALPNGLIAAEYKSNGLTKAGKPYPNVYAAFLEVTDGKITRWREYFNPDVVTAAMS